MFRVIDNYAKKCAYREAYGGRVNKVQSILSSYWCFVAINDATRFTALKWAIQLEVRHW